MIPYFWSPLLIDLTYPGHMQVCICGISQIFILLEWIVLFFFLLVTNILLKRGLTRDNPIRKILEQWHKRIISPKSEMYCWIRFMKYIVMFPIHDRPDGVCFSFLSEIWVSSYTDGDTWQWVSSHIWLGSQNMSASL